MTVCRGAASPRSASPIGPAPTRLPRMALPPPAATLRAPVECGLAVCLGSAARLEQQSQRDDAGDPDDAGTDRDPVEVPLRNRRTAETARDAAAEHVRQSAAPALVEQDQQNEEQARQHEEHGERDDHGGEAYFTKATSDDRHVVEPADTAELVGLQA